VKGCSTPKVIGEPPDPPDPGDPDEQAASSATPATSVMLRRRRGGTGIFGHVVMMQGLLFAASSPVLPDEEAALG
jgi:hypothetical protein